MLRPSSEGELKPAPPKAPKPCVDCRPAGLPTAAAPRISSWPCRRCWGRDERADVVEEVERVRLARDRQQLRTVGCETGIERLHAESDATERRSKKPAPIGFSREHRSESAGVAG